jgi:hypothetical protein
LSPGKNLVLDAMRTVVHIDGGTEQDEPNIVVVMRDQLTRLTAQAIATKASS